MESRVKDLSPQIEAYFCERSHYKHYINYKEHVSLTRNIDDMFICLKGVSSSTPFFHSSAFDDITGGGFYFRYKGKGIVVDPGIGFVTQMHRHNIFIDDIDYVIITHNHIDHCNDASSISAMNYDFNKCRSREHAFFSKFFDIDDPYHSIVWIVDDASGEQVRSFVNKESELILLSKIAENSPDYYEISDFISIKAVHTRHINGSTDSFGIKLRFLGDDLEYIWGYSSDTKYFPELLEFFDDCKALILNVSDIYPSDVKSNKLKSSHLGFTGCKEIITKSKSRLVLISEFACINGDNRFEIANLLADCTTDARVLPTEIGLKVSISVENAICCFCEQFEPLAQIKAIRPSKSFSKLKYVCNKCLL